MVKILIVEDEPLVIRMYQKALEMDGFQVVSAISGERGIETARREKPDIILLDIMMPVMNGIEALGHLKEDPELSQIPVIMLTNLSGVHDIELAKEKGAVDYWVKKDVRPRDMKQKFLDILEPKKDTTEGSS